MRVRRCKQQTETEANNQWVNLSENLHVCRQNEGVLKMDSKHSDALECAIFLSLPLPVFPLCHLLSTTDYKMTKQLSQLGSAASKIIISNEVEQNLANESKYFSLFLPCKSFLTKSEASALSPAVCSYSLLCTGIRDHPALLSGMSLLHPMIKHTSRGP